MDSFVLKVDQGQERGSGQTGIPTYTPTYTTVEQFVAHVIYDGRFLETFTEDPEGVAVQLDIAITPGIVAELRGRERGQVLEEVTSLMTREYGRRSADQGLIPEIHADFGFSAAIVGGAIVVGIVVCVCKCSDPIVTDQSPNAGEKL